MHESQYTVTMKVIQHQNSSIITVKDTDYNKEITEN